MKKLLLGVVCLFLMPMVLSAQNGEICFDGIDNDFDGRVDDADTDCIRCVNKQDNVWFFGVGQALDFNLQNPQAHAFNGASSPSINAREGTTTVCDPNGNLLFYSDGREVWNASHASVAGGLMGGITATHAALSCPHPGDRETYYIFTAADANNPDGMYFHDVSVGGGNVVVSLPGIPVLDHNGQSLANSNRMSEKLALARHANCRDFWVIAHDFVPPNTQAMPNEGRLYYSYLVDDNGFNAAQFPVASITGRRHQGVGNPFNRIGQISVSEQHDRIAAVIHRDAFVDVSDFDGQTGLLSNTISINVGAEYITEYGPVTTGHRLETYGCGFSPDGNFLYVTISEMNGNNPVRSVIFQYGIASGTVPGTPIIVQTAAREYGQVKPGPNGNVYVVRGDLENFTFATIVEITNPNTTNPIATNLTNVRIPVRRGLPQTIPDYHVPKVDIADVTLCAPGTGSLTAQPGYQGITYSVPPHLPFTYIWGDPNFQTTATATNLATGTYNVTATDVNGCRAFDNGTLSVTTVPLTAVIQAPTGLCGNSLTMTANAFTTSTNLGYAWSTSPVDVQQSVTLTGLAPGTYTYNVTVTDLNSGCFDVASFFCAL
ncbi:MAG: hypothetical protein AAF570_12635 [Bacteroidota bacterium]